MAGLFRPFPWKRLYPECRNIRVVQLRQRNQKDGSGRAAVCRAKSVRKGDFLMTVAMIYMQIDVVADR